MLELYAKTIEWAEKNKIVPNGTVQAQTLKLISEAGELACHVENSTSIKDDIGDMLVVVAIVSKLSNIELDLATLIEEASILDDAVGTDADGILLLLSMLGELSDKVLKGEDLELPLLEVVTTLYFIARTHKLTLEECWYHAYQDIKDRRGILTKAGVFIKSTDIAYRQITEILALCDNTSDVGDIVTVISSDADAMPAKDMSLERLHKLIVEDGYTAVPF